MIEKLKYRMYGLVPYNISPIQQGIQFGHGVVEYMMNNFNKPETQYWANNDKTFIILNGGTTNNFEGELGTLNKNLITLKEKGILVSTFSEPDLGNQLTSINFLVDERVWDTEKFPDFISSNYWWGATNKDFKSSKEYIEWVQLLGGETNVWLREFLRQFRLA